ncbi:MAG: diguanylate cyclase, partial [Lachnospiraceae bacterium]|nr:diguanylate cyclase [Lachnospiraceae bacterium]
MKKFAVIFPGVGYTKDRPLLYYAAKSAVKRGYEPLWMDFSGLEWSKEKLKDPDFLSWALDTCLEKTRDRLGDINDPEGPEFLFISKSIGTVVAAAYAEEINAEVRHIMFSPLILIKDYVREGSALLFYGDRDPFVDHNAIEKIAEEKRLEMHRIEGGNHSLETGDIERDIENLKSMIRTAEGRNGAYSHLLSDPASDAERIIKDSLYDHLTGLPSMTAFFGLADAGCRTIIKKGRHPYFLFLDLNGMEFFNHRNGFSKGDSLLRSFAHLLTRYFGDDNCCRFGEDHFAVFTDEQAIDEILHELFTQWQSSPDTNSLPVRVGVYHFQGDEADISSAYDCAMLACDSLKNTAVSAIGYYNENLQAEADKKHYVVSNLDKAIERGWLKVWYQPVVRAVNGRVCGEEALSRWIDPVRGTLMPSEFIPV